MPGALVLLLYSVAARSSEGFILNAGDGEAVLNGIVIKLTPDNATEGSILVEQTFNKGRSTGLHLHEQGDELFYVISGQGTATLGDVEKPVGPGDVIYVPRNAVHRIRNAEHDVPLVVVFFMESAELIEFFQALHERRVSEPDRPVTPGELAELGEKNGGLRTIV
jgi:quercetin dioxygenase-like cupin family protein